MNIYLVFAYDMETGAKRFLGSAMGKTSWPARRDMAKAHGLTPSDVFAIRSR